MVINACHYIILKMIGENVFKINNNINDYFYILRFDDFIKIQSVEIYSKIIKWKIIFNSNSSINPNPIML